MVRTGRHLGRQPHFDLFVDLAIEWMIRLRIARRFWPRVPAYPLPKRSEGQRNAGLARAQR